MSFSSKHHQSSFRNGGKTEINIPLSKVDCPSEKKARKISKKPYKILDAPNLQDDFYLNLLAWSDNNQIAVALDTSLYLWSGCST